VLAVAAAVSLAGLPAVLVQATPAQAQSAQSAGDDRTPEPGDKADVDRRLTAARKVLASARSEADDVNDALADIDSELDGLQSSLSEARRHRADAILNNHRAADLLKVTTASVEPLMEAVGGRARTTYMIGPANGLETLVNASNAQELAERTMYLDLAARNQSDQLGALEAATLQLSAARLDSVEARQQLVSTTTMVRSRTTQLRQARTLRAKAKKVLDAKVAEAQDHADALEAESQQIALIIRVRTHGLAGIDPAKAKGALQWPNQGCHFTSPFGTRWGRMHEGVDLGCPSGTPVHAAAAGTVLDASVHSGYGNLILVDHGGGIVTAYAHNSAFVAHTGQKVKAGQVIARSGNTGHSTGPHIHFEVRVNGEPRDPMLFLPPHP
jgi:murein DD-endopeptidase MepM/ murein hydrolase activator NlpD